MNILGPKTRKAYREALKYIPYGINSNARYWGEAFTQIAERGQGAYIWDIDGKRFIDYRLGFGPVILGHAYPDVNEKVQQAIENGSLFAWTTPLEISVAERICRLTGVDKVRLTNTGSESNFHALRIARAYTGREKFIKFEGQYHGMVDYFMFSTGLTEEKDFGPRTNPTPSPTTLGIPKAIRDYVICLPFNDFEMLEEAVERNWQDLAAIFVEPILFNAAGISPKPGFLETMRRLCDKYGILLVFDEVKTGFRIANGGGQEYFGVKADLACYAKAMANGFPIAAIGGKKEAMMTIRPYIMEHGGTYIGNLVGVAAADATLEILENEPVIDSINQRGTVLMNGISEILTEQGIPHVLTGVPSCFHTLLGIEEEPVEYRQFFRSDDDLIDSICMELIQRGVQFDGEGKEPWFLCYALSDEDVAETLDAFHEAVKAVKG